MATNPVTRRLAFNTMCPQPVGAARPVDPDGQVALHYTHLIIFSHGCIRPITRWKTTCGWPLWRRIGALIFSQHFSSRPANRSCPP
eukprot:3984653-Pleurochrysis_carterae.AAC.1